MQKFSRDVTVILNQITYQTEGSDVIAGRIDTGIFLSIPAEAKEILDLLAQGMTIGQVSDSYQQKYGETPDLEDFLTLLETKGLISVTGEKPRKTIAAPKKQQLKYHFSNFPQPLARLLFGKIALIVYSATILAAVAEIIANPSLMPSVSSLYFPSDRALTWGLVAAATYLSLFLHELGHLIAARAHGINSRLGIGHRLWFLVAETDLTGLWSISRNERYVPFLAGMIWDTLMCAALIGMLAAQLHGTLVFSPLVFRFLRALFFTLVMRIAWQFFLYIRTDIYFVIANALKCRNLLGDTEVFLRNQASRIFPAVRKASQDGIPKHELNIIKAYAVIWIVGRIYAFMLLFTVTLPVAAHYARDLRAAFIAGYSSSPANFIDSFVLSMCFFIPLSIGAALWIQHLIRRGRTLSWLSQ